MRRAAGSYGELLERLKTLPGVRSASLSQDTLLSGSSYRGKVRPVDQDGASATPRMDVYALQVGPNFFETMQIPLLRGRSLAQQDSVSSLNVAVVNTSMAKGLFKSLDVLGKRFLWYADKGERPTEIVGVVADAKYRNARQSPPPTVYTPYRLLGLSTGEVHFEVRVQGTPEALIPAVRALVSRTDSQLILFDMKSQIEQFNESIASERAMARLTSVFGILALVLSSLGIYAIIAHTIARRTFEIGVRLALGAAPRTIFRLMLYDVLLLVAVGAVVGLLGAMAGERAISSRLYGVRGLDPVAIGISVVLFLSMAICAVWIPTITAVRVDIVKTLRAN